MSDVTSYNQSGGITAHTISQAADDSSKRSSRWKRVFLIVSGLVGTAAAVVGVLQWLGITPWGQP